MSERANRPTYADWHNPAVVDNAAARFHLTLCGAWNATCTVATGASFFLIGFKYAGEAPEGTDKARGILAKPKVHDADLNHTGYGTISQKNIAVAQVEFALQAI